MLRNNAIQFCRVVLSLGALLTAGTACGHAGTFAAFGPKDYVRGTGSPVTVTDTFTVLNPSTQYTVKVFNGGLLDSDTELVSSGFVIINGVQVIGENNFSQNVTEVDVPVTLQSSNTISVQVRGQPGGTLTVEILGVDNDPPLIIASVSPSPNAAGWNNTDVTVSFTCSDATSGVKSCPPPQTVVTDGANQVITGAAADNAGNIASTSVTINIDRTPPTIQAVASPRLNAAGWSNSNVTVTFNCGDTLSGIARCTLPTTISSDGARQVVTGTATDLAGNTASTSITVKLDKTPPTITATVSPAPNSAGWNKTNPTVTFTCADSNSGIAVCPPPQTISNEVSGLRVSGTAIDVAGNTASTSVTVNLDKTAPGVSITSPANGSTIALGTSSIGIIGRQSDAGSGVASVNCNGAAAVLSGPGFSCAVSLSQGANSISVQAADVAGNTSNTSVTVNYSPAPQVAIISPANLSITNVSPVTVNGTVNDPGATLTLNGIAVPQSGGAFSTPVPLVEGLNLLTVVATNGSGISGSATVQITLDTTPPHLTIDSPADGTTTTAASVTVTGSANDIVVGTVNSQDVQVSVNGIDAQVANRSYSVANLPLVLGQNTIQATAHDRAGNGTTTSITLMRVLPSQPPPAAIGQAVIAQWLNIVSGNNQSGTVGAQLTSPVVVSLTDKANQPVPNQTVVFKVTGNNGTVTDGNAAPASAIAVTTDANGQAQILWTLGQRAGSGINTLQASSALAVSPTNFTATGINAPATQIVVDSGNNQTGVLGQDLPFPLVAIVVDAGHNRVPNVPVTFTVTQGNGNVGGMPATTINTDSNGRAIAVLTLGLQDGVNNNIVEASFTGNTGAAAAFVATAKAPGNPANTTISGVVLDNSNQPIQGATIRLFKTNQGNANNLPVQIGTPVLTGPLGTFVIPSAPVGSFKLMADGTTAQGPNAYPTLEYDIVTVAGTDNTVGMPIYLPALDTTNKLCVDETHGGQLTLPQVPGFALTVLPGSATFPGGSRQGCITVTPVNGDKVPMSPGFGQQPRFIVTIQPVGTTFNPPAPITLPNVDGLKPKAVTEMYSYDHDLGMFIAIGTGTVSDDGSVIVSNAGVGVLKAGWHCGGDPNSTGSAGTCPDCQTCQGSNCAPDPSQDGQTLASDPCKVCSGGSPQPKQINSVQVTANGSSDPVYVKPKTPVQFSATADTNNCTNLTYKWDFGDGSSSTDQNPTHTYTTANAYKPTVTVTCDSCTNTQNGEIDVNVVQIQITSPCTDTPQLCSISGAAPPAMPTINGISAMVVGVNPDPTSQTSFDWTAQVTEVGGDCNHDQGTTITAPAITATVVGGQFTPDFAGTYGGALYGGQFQLTATAMIGGQTFTGDTKQQPNNDDEHILGTNPDSATLMAAFPHNTLRAIACQETGGLQFVADSSGVANACPNWSRDNLLGVGIMQITPYTKVGQGIVWDWSQNASAGVRIFNGLPTNGHPGFYANQVASTNSFNQAITTLNNQRVANHLQPLNNVIVPDFTTGDYNANLQQDELDTIRGYNGWGGRDVWGLPLHEFRVLMDPNNPGLPLLTINNQTLIGSTQWQQVLAAQRPQTFGDPNYVNHVLGQLPLNGGNACQ